MGTLRYKTDRELLTHVFPSIRSTYEGTDDLSLLMHQTLEIKFKLCSFRNNDDINEKGRGPCNKLLEVLLTKFEYESCWLSLCVHSHV